MGLAALVVFLVAAMATATFFRAGSAEPRELRFAPTNALVLEQICRVTGKLLSEGEPPHSVQIDLSKVPYLPAGTMAALEHACDRWDAAGARVTLEECSPDAAAAIWRRAVKAEVRCRAAMPASSALH